MFQSDVIESRGRSVRDRKSTTKVQIKQIAEHLGLSYGTVSIVLNGRGDEMRISKATQQLVRDVAKEMNYQPNIYARRLRKSAEEEAPYIIAIFWREDYLDELLGQFLKGLYQIIKEKNLKVEIILQPYDFGNLIKYKRSLNSNHFHGAIIGGVSNEDQQFIEEEDIDIPIVLVGRVTGKYNSVLIDDYKAGKSCADLFLSRKHKTVGLIGFQTKGKSAQLVERAFIETCKENKINIGSDYIAYCEERNFESGYASALKILSNEVRPTALFIMDGRNAGGVLKACRIVELEVPEDIEILVFGDNEYFDYFNPTITTINHPIFQFAEKSLINILDSIQNNNDIPRTEKLAPVFNIRESCGDYIL